MMYRFLTISCVQEGHGVVAELIVCCFLLLLLRWCCVCKDAGQKAKRVEALQAQGHKASHRWPHNEKTDICRGGSSSSYDTPFLSLAPSNHD